MRIDTLKGQLLVATPRLRESTFERTVVALLEHDVTAGALGVVVNRPSDIAIDDVVPAVGALVTPPAVLFHGGPVSPETAVALGRAGADHGVSGEGWAAVAPSLLTVDLDHDVDVLASSLTSLRVFAGYAGWSPGQLEDEIADGAWYVVDRLPLDPFMPDPDRLWSAVLRRQGWPLSAVAVCPRDPTLN